MPKRRISQQQRTRIKHQQTTLSTDTEQAIEGLVITRFNRRALVATPDGRTRACMVRPHVEAIVAGDKVMWIPEDDDHGVVIKRCPRRSALVRQNARNEERAVAANLTHVIIVIAPIPAPTWHLLDAYLVMAETLGLRATIVLNKIDLLPAHAISDLLAHTYAPLGYTIVHTHQGALATLPDALTGEVSVFVGQSGVGKSSLINQLLPDNPPIRTGAVSIQSNLGSHTTSQSTWYSLSNEGAIIDSPGVRAFEPAGFSRNDILYGFREFRDLVEQCRFRNCDHGRHEKCAIYTSVLSGYASELRYHSLQAMLVGS